MNHTIPMTVIATDGLTIRLSHAMEIDEPQGYTGAELVLHFNRVWAPLVAGQIVEVTLRTGERILAERIATDEQGQPEHVEHVDPGQRRVNGRG